MRPRINMKYSDKIMLKIKIILLLALLSCNNLRAAVDNTIETSGKIKVNLALIRDFFSTPVQLITANSPAGPWINGIQKNTAAEFAAALFPADNLAQIFNAAGFSREQLMQLKQINFTNCPGLFNANTDDTSDEPYYTITVNWRERTVNVLPSTFFYPANLAEDLIWGAGLIVYYTAPDQTGINAALDSYLNKCNLLEQRRKTLIDGFYDTLECEALTILTRPQLLNYIAYRQFELTAVIQAMNDFKHIIPNEKLENSQRNLLRRVERLKEIELRFCYNLSAPLLPEDIQFICGDIIAMSSSDNSFYCNTIENMNSMREEGDYAVLYALCLGHYYSLTNMCFGYIAPGYNAFRQQWQNGGIQPDNAETSVSAGDFEIIFSELPQISGNYYKLYSMAGID